MDLTGGILGCRGYHSSFQSVQGGLFLNLGELMHCPFGHGIPFETFGTVLVMFLT